MIYNKEYFINKFKTIPEEQWCTGWYFSFDKKTGQLQHCALGHCNASAKGSSSEAEALQRLFLRHLRVGVEYVNDNPLSGYHNYRQATPKARVLAALEDIPNG